mmetsp:Transcript_34704/g.84501  ORF Transcript_34704/g.84501 Transcript_34704/m.84501 type:complete len:327 (-) Transcript_34704:878-1858(-)
MRPCCRPRTSTSGGWTRSFAQNTFILVNKCTNFGTNSPLCCTLLSEFCRVVHLAQLDPRLLRPALRPRQYEGVESRGHCRAYARHGAPHRHRQRNVMVQGRSALKLFDPSPQFVQLHGAVAVGVNREDNIFGGLAGPRDTELLPEDGHLVLIQAPVTILVNLKKLGLEKLKLRIVHRQRRGRRGRRVQLNRPYCRRDARAYPLGQQAVVGHLSSVLRLKHDHTPGHSLPSSTFPTPLPALHRKQLLVQNIAKVLIPQPPKFLAIQFIGTVVAPLDHRRNHTRHLCLWRLDPSLMQKCRQTLYRHVAAHDRGVLVPQGHSRIDLGNL